MEIIDGNSIVISQLIRLFYRLAVDQNTTSSDNMMKKAPCVRKLLHKPSIYPFALSLVD
ncbi:MAG: hypothetical protein WCG98_10135 [bacterium]